MEDINEKMVEYAEEIVINDLQIKDFGRIGKYCYEKTLLGCIDESLIKIIVRPISLNFNEEKCHTHIHPPSTDDYETLALVDIEKKHILYIWNVNRMKNFRGINDLSELKIIH